MTRAFSVGLVAVGVILLIGAWLLSAWGNVPAMPSYLAAWLIGSALPFGALPVVMLIDLGGRGAAFVLERALRRLLILTPIAALLIIPVLMHPDALFGWTFDHGFGTPFGRSWMTHQAWIGRTILYLILWAILAVTFCLPPAPSVIERRRTVAIMGLFVYALTITLAATDWAMAVTPDWFSAEFGLLFAASQAAIAVCAAVLFAGPALRVSGPEAASPFLLCTATVWAFAQFIQFLVIWSGNRPSEVVWYQDRNGAGGVIVVWFAFLTGVVAPVLLLMSRRLRRHPAVMTISAALILCAQVLSMLWLITPSIRHGFTITGMDALTVLGLGALSIGVCTFLGPLCEPAVETLQHA